jgi:uncharacterized protein (TIGR04255 family)
MSTYSRPADLPNFENPPVVEVVLSIQFEHIARLRTAQIGLLWTKLRAEFPKVEELAPIAPVIESFGPPTAGRVGFRFEALDVPPLARVLFLNDSQDQLVQIQPDRLLHNWRKTTGAQPYPRYGAIREAFLRELGLFQEFLAQESVGPLRINQCEVTYVNHILPAGAWVEHGDADKIFRVLGKPMAGPFLPAPEDVGMQLRYVIRRDEGTPLGRLHVSIQPGWLKPENAPMYVLELTARGAPVGADVAGARSFFDIGHDWIVRGFKDLTTSTMHETWRLTNG